MKFRSFSPDVPSGVFVTSNALLAKNRDLVVRGLQGIALSTRFAQVNPIAAARSYYAQFQPPTGDPAQTLRNDVHAIERTLSIFKQPNDGHKWGEMTEALLEQADRPRLPGVRIEARGHQVRRLLQRLVDRRRQQGRHRDARRNGREIRPGAMTVASPARSETNHALEVSAVGLTYRTSSGSVEALRGITLGVREGEFVSVVGPSGCGKSSLLKLILGLERATRGSLAHRRT